MGIMDEMGVFARLFGRKRKKKGGLQEVPLELIHSNPFQPRREYPQEDLRELAESIREHGLLHPIIVREAERGYEVVSGERRVRACLLLERKTIPAIIGEFSDGELMEIALLENIQRKDLTVLEEGLGYWRLQDRYRTKNLERLASEISQRIGKPQEEIKERLELAKQTPLLQKAVEKELLSLEQAQMLSGLDTYMQKLLLRRIARAKVSREVVEGWIGAEQAGASVQHAQLKEFLAFLPEALELLNRTGLQATYHVRLDGKKKTTIEIVVEGSRLQEGDSPAEAEREEIP